MNSDQTSQRHYETVLVNDSDARAASHREAIELPARNQKYTSAARQEDKNGTSKQSSNVGLWVIIIVTFVLAASALVLVMVLAFGQNEKVRSLEQQLNLEKQQNKLNNQQMKNLSDIVATQKKLINDQMESNNVHIKSEVLLELQNHYVLKLRNDFGKVIVGHDSMGEIEASNCEEGGCYKRTITYNKPMNEIVTLIQNSAYCRQFIKYRCWHSMLLYDNKAWWVDRNGNMMNYWGGAVSRRDSLCACGENSTCHNNGQCNCDANIQTELSDEGYLDDKDVLPVTQLAFGDLNIYEGFDERGWHTLGPLECFDLELFHYNPPTNP